MSPRKSGSDLAMLRAAAAYALFVPGARVHLSFNPGQTGVVLANHKTGVLVHLDSGPSRYYDGSWLVRMAADESKED